MDPFEYMKTLTAMWSKGGAALWSAQQSMFLDMAEQAGRATGVDGAAGAAPMQLPDMAGLEKAGQDFARLWSSALEVSKAATRHLQSGSAPSPVVTEMVGKMFDPRLWFASNDNMDEALNRMAEGPRLADLWITERKIAAVFSAWVRLRERNLEHNRIMLEAWTRAAEVFTKTMKEKSDKDEAFESWRDMMTAWVEIANKTLLETQRTEPYLVSQRELLKASTALRLAQQEVAEFYSEMFGYPTRAELDDVHKTVTELRRELRALKRQAGGIKQRVEPKTEPAMLARETPEAPSIDKLAASGSDLHGQGMKSQ